MRKIVDGGDSQHKQPRKSKEEFLGINRDPISYTLFAVLPKTSTTCIRNACCSLRSSFVSFRTPNSVVRHFSTTS